MDLSALLLAGFGIALGGFLKGATGAGAPVVGVPLLALAVGVPEAVAIFAMLNLLSNTWQVWAFRSALGEARFVWSFALAGALGVVAGSFLLASLSTDLLLGSLAAIVFLYIGLRIARPDWRITRAQGRTLAGPVGFVGGVMQGAGGISAPVSITFLNGMRLDRSEFAATISLFFLTMALLQIPTLIGLGLLDWERVGVALLAAIPLFGAMPLGAAAAKRISKAGFDRLVLAILALVALRLLSQAVW